MPRCKNGSRRNKKTGKCVRKKSKSKKICTSNKLLDPKTNRCIKDNTKNRKKLKMKTIKLCPPGKLLNTKTNRCILNNTRNRKKLNIFIDIKKKEKVSKIKKSDVNIFTDKCKSYDNLVSIDLNKVEAFIIPPGLGVNYKAGTWHFPLISTEDMNFLVVDRKGSGDNLKIQKLEENQLVLKY